MQIFSRKEKGDTKGRRQNVLLRICLCLFLVFVISELLMGFIINRKTSNILVGVRTIQKFFFNVSSIQRSTFSNRTLKQKYPRTVLTIKTTSAVKKKEANKPKLRNASATSALSVLDTSKMPYYEFFYQKCDWIQKNKNNKTKVDQMYSSCSKLCPSKPPGLVGNIHLKMESISFEEQGKKFSKLKPGGRYSPPDCIARHHVAIIIAFRNREPHLRILLNNLHPFLQKQQLDYGIFVIEQAEGSKFNRAMLMNIGFKEALAVHNYSCFIFHDVDHIPENDNNVYGCYGNPRHMAVAVDKFKYRLLYGAYFGGVSSLSKREMEKVNGFSNRYFGWGGEDDDMWRRIQTKKLKVVRYALKIGRYRTVLHKRDKGNEASGVNLAQVNKAVSSMDKDGLNSLKYEKIKMEERKLYTWILVQINQTEITNDKL